MCIFIQNIQKVDDVFTKINKDVKMIIKRIQMAMYIQMAYS